MAPSETLILNVSASWRGSGEAIFYNLHRDIHLLNHAEEMAPSEMLRQNVLVFISSLSGEEVELVAGNVKFSL